MGEGWPTKRKYITMNLMWFAVIAAFAVTLAVVLLYKPGAVTAGDLDRLKQGMTPEEVLAILGEPAIGVRATIVPGDAERVWTYSLPASHWSVTKSHYQLRFADGQLDSWWQMK